MPYSYNLPNHWWICEDCKCNWSEDDAVSCPNCRSYNIKEEM